MVKLVPNYKDAGQKLASAQQKLDAIKADADKKQQAGDFAGAIDSLKQAGKYKNADTTVLSLSQLMTSLDQL